MRVLIVDDSHIIREALGSWLKDLKLEIVGKTDNGREAVKLAQELHPDIVTMDITMPEMDGLTAMEKILAFAPHTKVIVISALSAREIALSAIKKGAASYLMKPFTRDELKEVFFEVLGGE